jgi:glycosyltransferase involved in cell wall biosynthesis
VKICFECFEYPPGSHGGIGSLVQILARGLVQAGHQVRVIGIYDADYPAPDEQVDQGVQVRRLRFSGSRLGWIPARRRMYRQVREWVEAGEVELMEVPDFGAPAAFWPRLPIPVVVRLSGAESYFRSEMGRPLRWTTFRIERASLRRADFICSESKYVAEKTLSLFGLSQAIDRIIYNPVEVPELAPDVEREPYNIMFAGTLTRKKGILTLVEAWPAIRAAVPEARLHIWGRDGQTDEGGSMHDYLTTIIPAALKESVVFHGLVPLPDLLVGFQKAGVVVLPSYSEGFALTPLHAMAAACPVVYTTRGSGPELIDDGVTGLLVNPEDPKEIAGAVLRLLADPAGARAMGAKGRETVRARFSLDTLMAENEAFYKECMDRFHAPRHS